MKFNMHCSMVIFASSAVKCAKAKHTTTIEEKDNNEEENDNDKNETNDEYGHLKVTRIIRNTFASSSTTILKK